MRRPLILILFSFLVLAACDSSSDGTGDTTTSIAPETSTSGAATTDTSEATTTTVATETTTTAARPTGGASCVEGSWIFSSETFVAAMGSAMTDAEMAGAEIQPTDGTYTVTFESNGNFTGVRDNWGFAIDADEGQIVIRIDGMESGTWSADDSTITVQVDSSDVQVAARVEADGQVFDLPDSPVQVPEAIAEASSYQCDSDTLTVNSDEFTFVLDRR